MCGVNIGLLIYKICNKDKICNEDGFALSLVGETHSSFFSRLQYAESVFNQLVVIPVSVLQSVRSSRKEFCGN